MTARGVQTITGPLAWVAWTVALGWFVLGVVGALVIDSPWNWVVAGVAGLAGVLTVVLGFGLRVKVAADAVRAAGQTHRWASVVGLRVPAGRFVTPQLQIAQGRAVLEVPLEGIAWGRRTALTLAGRVAAAGGAKVVDDVGTPHRAARRAA